ncbi:hypothetical protein Tco_0791288 [Tanacetum coccineum]
MKTPMSSDTKLTKDEECESVDSTKYRGMIGSLLYLTTSTPDIMFSVYLCACFQEDPKTSHLEAKQTALAISTTEAEYVSAGKTCQQALCMKQDLIDYDIRLDKVTAHTLTSGHLTTWRLALLQKAIIKPLLLPQVSLKLSFKLLDKAKIIRENVFCLRGHRDHVLFSNYRYILCDRVMHPLAPHYEQKTRSDHATKRCRSSNPSSSSNVLDHPSSSHHIDENDEESFQFNTPSPSQLINSLSNVVWICQILQEISQERTRERMSDQEAKDLKAEAREIMPQPSTVKPQSTQTQAPMFYKSQGPNMQFPKIVHKLK